MAADLITLAEGVLLTQFLSPTAKHYGEAALKRIQQLGERAKSMLANTGREPQGVEEKILLPLVQAASLETDPTLADLWAALLANAADPAQKVQIQASFASILRDLTVYDAFLLEAIAHCALQAMPEAPVNAFTLAATVRAKVKLAVDEEVFYVALDNLGRLNLTLALGSKLLPNGTLATGFHPSSKDLSPGKEKVTITHLGLAFLVAVAPPTP